MDTNNIAFELILFSGNGRSSAMEAIQEAKQGNFERAEELLKQATEELGKAHNFQTQLIQAEADGKSNPVNILLVHAQDHLMTAMTVRDLAAEIVELYKKLGGR
ncbi:MULTISPECIES: PTS lactose/cellobiose transporter subunit IIA [Clostridium]|jgi:cellobiose PTS system EIIA component|uniref:Lichenan-specific phosphotransferase enzyme IIA component n=2 Tax=Clostridium TaxID=1485 RepID=A0A151AL23_9CLOT|nr:MULTISPECIES: PTS lactose/cellobiose transporter subunit IIA [Clostridium]KYH28323.1 lichenan-specific phosphotransferase enzyme IIA component [Clostridium colicanis DSM 13634]MBE6043619.1 PTS lactose/cellobiose transporter subunit IIA [Clostridium thermopalmarium]PRR68765.1 Lichenan-specific phosphotransferase enzyme IIA component [Clostridium thermopalmarium DSM 5974]PVZ22652.1 PTS system cellobiose-specific IIA component [Clostridium thermopalmarium DSM 5974]